MRSLVKQEFVVLLKHTAQPKFKSCLVVFVRLALKTAAKIMHLILSGGARGNAHEKLNYEWFWVQLKGTKLLDKNDMSPLSMFRVKNAYGKS